jgi:hypothetical protein
METRRDLAEDILKVGSSAAVMICDCSVGHRRIAIAWLLDASLFYYGWWNPAYLGLIISSMLANYAVGIILSSISRSEEKKIRKWLLIVGPIVHHKEMLP